MSELQVLTLVLCLCLIGIFFAILKRNFHNDRINALETENSRSKELLYSRDRDIEYNKRAFENLSNSNRTIQNELNLAQRMLSDERVKLHQEIDKMKSKLKDYPQVRPKRQTEPRNY